MLFFPQVFSDLRVGDDFEMASVERSHLPVVVGFDSIAFHFDDAVDFGSDGPELAFVWCFIYHTIRVSERG